jgi:serine-type D-Ala-D-Ala carboxypeptidase (penicillin-binding protein 5/6)
MVYTSAMPEQNVIEIAPERHYALLALCTGISACVVLGALYAHTEAPAQVAVATPPTVEIIATPHPLYLRNSLVAQAAVVVDATTGHTLYDYRASESLPLASITKVMTALAAKSLLQGSDSVRITEAAMQTEGFDALNLGEVWTVDSLVDYMLITSSNRAARALMDAGEKELGNRKQDVDFIYYMNATAKRIGMTQTVFKNETGLDTNKDTVATNFGSAADVARLFTYVLAHETRLLEATENERNTLKSSNGAAHIAVTTNKALAEIPGLIGGKTGFTDVAGGNLAIAFDVEQGHPIVAVVLGSGKDERFTDMLTLVESVRNQFGVSSPKQIKMPI